MDIVEYVRHLITEHGFGTGDAISDAIGLSSPATKAYHKFLHETRQFAHTHEEIVSGQGSVEN